MINLVVKNFSLKIITFMVVLSVIASNLLSFSVFASGSPNTADNSTASSTGSYSANNSSSKSDLIDKQKMQETLKKKNEKLTAELNNAKSDASNLEKQRILYQEKINVLQQQIDFTNSKIRDLDKDINAKQSDINQKQNQIYKNYEKLTGMIRVFYMSGESYNIDILMDAKNFSDFLDKADMVKNVGEHYNELARTLQEQISNLKSEKQEKEQMKQVLEQSKKELNDKQSELTTVLQENESLLNLFNEDQAYIQKKIDSNSAAMKEIDGKILNYYQSKKSDTSNNTYNSTITKSPGMFQWPVPGFTYISSYWGDGRDHKGIDIAGAGIYGMPIVAAADAVVAISNSGNYGGGYGNYVMLDHGNSFATLYGHMSEVVVDEGQIVKRGETIGYVGSTGDSTGPHLHFEVIVDGEKQNPFDYLD